MRAARILFLLGLQLITITLANAAARDYLVPPGEKVEGVSQEELSVQWWQWAGSFAYEASPIADTKGDKCGAGQQGKVFFLAGTYESTVTRRTCKVPAGRYLFFPIINYVVMPSNCSGCLTCKDAEASAKSMTNNLGRIFAELDGEQLPSVGNHRAASPACFNLAERMKGAPKIEPTASNGYYLLLKPLPKGTHKLRFGAELPSLRQGLEYTLIVE